MKKRMTILLILIIINIAALALYYKYIVSEKANKVMKYNIGVIENIDLDKLELNKEKETEIYNIYLPSEDLTYLTVNNIEMEKDKTLNWKIEEIYMYIKNNAPNGISLETKLYNVYIEGNTAYLNFNKELARYMDSAESEQIIIYSIINSVCELSDIKQVKILVENQNVKELGGYIDISDYFRPDKLLIKGD